MATLAVAAEILEKIKELKILLIKAQDFENGALMRDMEKRYLDKKVITDKTDNTK